MGLDPPIREATAVSRDSRLRGNDTLGSPPGETKDLPRTEFISPPKQILRFAQEDSEWTAFTRPITPAKAGISEDETTGPPAMIHPRVSFRRNGPSKNLGLVFSDRGQRISAFENALH